MFKHLIMLHVVIKYVNLFISLETSRIVTSSQKGSLGLTGHKSLQREIEIFTGPSHFLKKTPLSENFASGWSSSGLLHRALILVSVFLVKDNKRIRR